MHQEFYIQIMRKKSPLNFHQLQHVSLTTLAAQLTAAHSQNTSKRVFFRQHAELYTSLSTCKPGLVLLAKSQTVKELPYTASILDKLTNFQANLSN